MDPITFRNQPIPGIEVVSMRPSKDQAITPPGEHTNPGEQVASTHFSATPHDDAAALHAAQADVRALKKQIAHMTADLSATLKQNRAGLQDLKQTIGANVQREIDDAGLLQKMLGNATTPPDYAAVRSAATGRTVRL